MIQPKWDQPCMPGPAACCIPVQGPIVGVLVVLCRPLLPIARVALPRHTECAVTRLALQQLCASHSPGSGLSVSEVPM